MLLRTFLESESESSESESSESESSSECESGSGGEGTGGGGGGDRQESLFSPLPSLDYTSVPAPRSAPRVRRDREKKEVNEGSTQANGSGSLFAAETSPRESPREEADDDQGQAPARAKKARSAAADVVLRLSCSTESEEHMAQTRRLGAFADLTSPALEVNASGVSQIGSADSAESLPAGVYLGAPKSFSSPSRKRSPPPDTTEASGRRDSFRSPESLTQNSENDLAGTSAALSPPTRPSPPTKKPRTETNTPAPICATPPKLGGPVSSSSDSPLKSAPVSGCTSPHTGTQNSSPKIPARFLLQEGVQLLAGGISRSESDSRWGADTPLSASSARAGVKSPSRAVGALSASSSNTVVDVASSPFRSDKNTASSWTRHSSDDGGLNTVVSGPSAAEPGSSRDADTIVDSSRGAQASARSISTFGSDGIAHLRRGEVSLPSSVSDAPSLPSVDEIGISPRVVLIDGSSLYFRATTATPTPGAALPIYVQSILRILNRLRPVHFAGVFHDFFGSTRHDSRVACSNPRIQHSPAYKANRRHGTVPVARALKLDVPADDRNLPVLSPDLARAACEAMGVFCLNSPTFRAAEEPKTVSTRAMFDEWEADDVIGSFARQFSEQGCQVSIVANDKDMLQCVAPRVCVCRSPNSHHGSGSVCVLDPYPPTTGREGAPRMQFYWNDDDVKAKPSVGVACAAVPVFLALAGDSVDGVRGVVGIGAETAQLLCRTFSTITLDTVVNSFGTSERILRNILAAATNIRAENQQEEPWMETDEAGKIAPALERVFDQSKELKRNFFLVSLNTRLDLRDALELRNGTAVSDPRHEVIDDDGFRFLCSKLQFTGSNVVRHYAEERDAPLDAQGIVFSKFLEAQRLDTGNTFQRVQQHLKGAISTSSASDKVATKFAEDLALLPGFGAAVSQSLWIRKFRTLGQVRSESGIDGGDSADQFAFKRKFDPSPTQAVSLRFCFDLVDAAISRYEVQLHARMAKYGVQNANRKRSEHGLPPLSVNCSVLGEYRRGHQFSRQIVILLAVDGDNRAPALALQATIDELRKAEYVQGSFPVQQGDDCYIPSASCCPDGSCARVALPRYRFQDASKNFNHHLSVEWHGVCKVKQSPVLSPSPKKSGPRTSIIHRNAPAQNVDSPDDLTPSSSRLVSASSEDSAFGAPRTVSKARLVTFIAVRARSQATAELFHTGPPCYVELVREAARQKGYFLCRHMFSHAHPDTGLPISEITADQRALTERDILETFGQGGLFRAPEKRDEKCRSHPRFSENAESSSYVS
jgi:5'-3' exonuclease